jgi:putative ABC transport system ATP-binding protein
MPEKCAIELKGVTKFFPAGDSKFTALDSVNLSMEEGRFVAILGKSGSGKSTLLHMIAGIDTPSAGEIRVNGSVVHEMNQEQLAVWRGKNIGIVFQFFQLLPTLTVKENVLLAMDFCNVIPAALRKKRVESLLEQFGISAQSNQLPVHLSGGQQQRAAMARALANDPPIILADEPTGNLDSTTAEGVLQLFSQLSTAGKTIVMVTHEREIQNIVDQTITLSDGHIVREDTYAGTMD